MAVHRIAPGNLVADCARRGDEVRAVIAAGAGWVHFDVDVMDDHDVPNPTSGPAVAQAIAPRRVKPEGTAVPLDVHLMVRPVDALATAFAGAGAFVAGRAIFGQRDDRAAIDAVRSALAA